MRPFKLLSPAKINLILRITGKRKDGYHSLATLFQKITLYDRLSFHPVKDGKIHVICDNRSISQKKNLAYKAAKALWKPGLPGITISLEKKIPTGAGLGGGSSNAATVLLGLNKAWNLQLSNAELMKLGKNLGADVPFFLGGPRAWATGIGEKLTPLPNAEPFHIVLVKPRINIPTPSVYIAYHCKLTNKLRPVRIPREARGLILFEDTVRYLRNDLESTALGMHPVLARIKGLLRGKFDSDGVMLSGTGSTIFALFKSYKKAHSVRLEMLKRKWWCELAKPIITGG